MLKPEKKTLSFLKYRHAVTFHATSMTLTDYRAFSNNAAVRCEDDPSTDEGDQPGYLLAFDLGGTEQRFAWKPEHEYKHWQMVLANVPVEHEFIVNPNHRGNPAFVGRKYHPEFAVMWDTADHLSPELKKALEKALLDKVVEVRSELEYRAVMNLLVTVGFNVNAWHQKSFSYMTKCDDDRVGCLTIGYNGVIAQTGCAVFTHPDNLDFGRLSEIIYSLMKEHTHENNDSESAAS